jgi:hypothetical protein
MRSYKGILPAAIAIVTIACGPQESLNPLCTNDNAEVDPALTGAWQAVDGNGILEIYGSWHSYATADTSSDWSQTVPADRRTYAVTYVEGKNKRTWTFDGRLIRLGDDSFMDITPGEAEVDCDFKYFPVTLSKDGELPLFTKLSELFYMALVPSQPEDNGTASGDSSEMKLIAAHTFIKVTLEDERLRTAWLDREWLGDMIRDARISIDHQQVGDSVLLTASPEDLQDMIQQISNEPDAFKEFGDWRRKR